MKQTRKNLFQKRRPLNISQIISLVFLGIILLGALLLSLPIASRSGMSCGAMKAVFTATSATCVTGLILADTWTQWSGFGQAVILGLIETGGLGFMSAASLVIMSLKRKVNMNQQLMIAQSLGSDDISQATQVQAKIIRGCLSVEGVGAVVLALRFLPKYGLLKALRLGIFHSVSAFCNAGFDIFGFETPGQSLIPYGTDPIVCTTLAMLIIIGGIGFLVWDEIFTKRSFFKMNVYSKLVIISTVVLLFGGAFFICITEWNNPLTMGNMTVDQKLVAGFFQSATSRTAGFDALNQGAMTDGGKAVTMLLMIIGGSSGSTAGGIKTVTFAVLLIFLWSKMRGKDSVSVFFRTIPNKHILNAVTIFGIMIILAFAGGMIICMDSGINLTDSLYESISALATVGLTTGITPTLGRLSKLLLIAYMYFGRVGVLTVSLGFMKNKHNKASYKYAETNLLIG